MKADARMIGWMAALAETDRVVSCAVVRGEILYGIGKLDEGRRRTELESQAEALFRAVPCEPVPVSAAPIYAGVKLDQERRGLSLDENDLWIALTALAIGATLVSRDNDFKRVDRLAVADL